MAFNIKLQHSLWSPDHPTVVYITIGIWKKYNSSRKLFCCCFFTSCFLFPIAGQLRQNKDSCPPNSGDKKTKTCVNIFRENFNPLTLKRIEEGNWFILNYFYSIYFYLFILYLSQTAHLRRKGGGFNGARGLLNLAKKMVPVLLIAKLRRWGSCSRGLKSNPNPKFYRRNRLLTVVID